MTEQPMEKTVMVMTIAIFGLAVIAQVVQSMTPSRDYCCPVLGCGECFYTYDDLYSHFVTAHPAEDISIVWE